VEKGPTWRPATQHLWGDRFTMMKLGERKVENDMTGFKFATSTGGVGTGERGDRIILDDPHNVITAESQLEREKTVRFFRESMSNRLNDDRSAIVIIMQRVHEGDVSGDILARESDYCHLMIPIYFESLRYPASADGERTEDPETGEPFEGKRGETDAECASRCSPFWGLVEHVAWSCHRFGGADALLVEAKANGLDVIHEMNRLYAREKWGVVPINPKMANLVVHAIWTAGLLAATTLAPALSGPLANCWNAAL
jgi:hypothetical protein